MRRIAHELGVVPMALYKHVANRDELLDGMVDLVVGEIDPPAVGVGWKSAVRQHVLNARAMLRRHPWASQAIESRNTATPEVMAYLDSVIGILLAGGLSVDLTHHAMHAMGSRILGFSQELFSDAPSSGSQPVPPPPNPERYPNIVGMVMAINHDPSSVVRPGCDDQLEFEFALDLLLDGLERLHAQAEARNKEGRA
jgi:AcrR family transcriptional regulator